MSEYLLFSPVPCWHMDACLATGKIYIREYGIEMSGSWANRGRGFPWVKLFKRAIRLRHARQISQQFPILPSNARRASMTIGDSIQRNLGEEVQLPNRAQSRADRPPRRSIRAVGFLVIPFLETVLWVCYAIVTKGGAQARETRSVGSARISRGVPAGSRDGGPISLISRIRIRSALSSIQNMQYPP
jgi:hypothetical protein